MNGVRQLAIRPHTAGRAVSWRHGPKPTVGLVGGIGAGKSAAAAALAARGGSVIDADALGHEALEQPAIKAALAERWGPGVFLPDGRVDRRAIARIVFADPAERAALETTVYPYIRERALSEITRGQADPAVRFVVLDAAVMLEAGWSDVCDRLIYVDAPADVRLARLAARSGWTAADVTAREAAQWPTERKKARADAVLSNDAGVRELEARADRLLASWGWESAEC